MPAHSAPAAHAGDHREHDVQQRRRAVERRADVDGGERADEVLALAADVEQAGAERERDGEAGEDQRRRQDQRLLQVQRRERPVVAGHPREQPVEAGALEDRLVGVDRVGAGGEDEEAADEEREQRGDERDEDAAAAQVARQPRRDGDGAGPASSATLTPRPTLPPSIATPSSSSLTSGASSATIRPS